MGRSCADHVTVNRLPRHHRDFPAISELFLHTRDPYGLFPRVSLFADFAAWVLLVLSVVAGGVGVHGSFCTRL